jgi:hypothetical protein
LGHTPLDPLTNPEKIGPETEPVTALERLVHTALPLAFAEAFATTPPVSTTRLDHEVKANRAGHIAALAALAVFDRVDLELD